MLNNYKNIQESIKNDAFYWLKKTIENYCFKNVCNNWKRGVEILRSFESAIFMYLQN